MTDFYDKTGMNETSKEELKPCPFCGCIPIHIIRKYPLKGPKYEGAEGVHHIECPNCHAYMQSWAWWDVRDKWNGESRLKPCPICGGHACGFSNGFDDTAFHSVECSKCGLATPMFAEKHEAREFWNNRINRTTQEAKS